MKFKFIISLILFIACSAFALSPNEILVLVNSDNESSVKVGEYYCQQRSVPIENLVYLSLGTELKSDISRTDYDSLVVKPLRNIIENKGGPEKIRCLLTTYGVPYRVGGRGPIAQKADSLKALQAIEDSQLKAINSIWNKANLLDANLNKIKPLTGPMPKKLQTLDQKLKSQLASVSRLGDSKVQKSKSRILKDLFIKFYGFEQARSYLKTLYTNDASDQQLIADAAKHKVKLQQARVDKWDFNTKVQARYYDSLQIVLGYYRSLNVIDAEVSYLKGKQTSAAFDSELSMILFGNYELYRWQPNELKQRLFWFGTKTMMVSRLDGPSPQIAKGLVDKAINAEKTGLKGTAYFDARGYSGNSSKGMFEVYDTRIMSAAQNFKAQGWNVRTEQSEALFRPAECPNTAIYCGWYSLKNYIPSFTFVDGAIGYHIASFEAIDLREPLSKQWVPNLLKDGITATIGAVAEPYLSSFPHPDMFFNHILAGKPLVEAYYKTNSYNSWQMILIGDPLYTPFKVK